MKILSFDVGKKGAWAFLYEEAEVLEAENLEFKSLAQYLKRVKELVDLYVPDIVVSARPVRFPRVIANHSKMLAMIEYACEKKGVQYYEVIDSECKKLVLGKGNVKKEEIMERYDEGDEHRADAKMFCEYVSRAFDI